MILPFTCTYIQFYTVAVALFLDFPAFVPVYVVAGSYFMIFTARSPDGYRSTLLRCPIPLYRTTTRGFIFLISALVLRLPFVRTAFVLLRYYHTRTFWTDSDLPPLPLRSTVTALHSTTAPPHTPATCTARLPTHCTTDVLPVHTSLCCHAAIYLFPTSLPAHTAAPLRFSPRTCHTRFPRGGATRTHLHLITSLPISFTLRSVSPALHSRFTCPPPHDSIPTRYGLRLFWICSR